MQELLKTTKLETLPVDIQSNLNDLHKKINSIRTLYGKPMIVSSGYRTIEQHKEIYRKYNKLNPPMGSRHLTGQAVDIADSNQLLQKWCLLNVRELESIGLWCEAFSATPNWVHFQTTPPASGRRFFLP